MVVAPSDIWPWDWHLYQFQRIREKCLFCEGTGKTTIPTSSTAVEVGNCEPNEMPEYTCGVCKGSGVVYD